MIDYTNIRILLNHELIQLEEEGYETGDLRRSFNDISGIPPASELSEGAGNALPEKNLDDLYPTPTSECLSVKPRFPYYEPLSLGDIKASRPKKKGQLNGRKVAGEAGEALDFGPLDEALSDEALFDKIYGAWLGRCAGCLLGKPVEGWTKKDIETYLRAVGAYPLEDFFPPMPPGLCNRDNLPTIREPKALKGSFEHMLRDDDIDYTILGLHILDTYGFDFTTDHIAQEWLARLPYLLTYTAERVAYKNLVNRITPPRSATHQNPYREWIGAQIRADIWGYVNPGQPERAAELAYRDATLSHVKNGVYGEMFVSAMLAAAFKTSSVKEVVEIGLSEIPEKSRLAEAIRNVVRWSQQFPTWQGTWNEIMAAYGHYNWVHTINNASIVIMALLHGEGDFGKSIGIAVMGGLDTDCNGATTGSILGAILGARGLPKSWAEPLNDTVESVVAGYHKVSISELARRTARLAKANLARISTEEQ